MRQKEEILKCGFEKCGISVSIHEDINTTLTDCSEKGSDLEMKRNEDDLFELMRTSVAPNWTVLFL